MLVFIVGFILAFLSMCIAEAGGEIGAGMRASPDPLYGRGLARAVAFCLTMLAACVARFL